MTSALLGIFEPGRVIASKYIIERALSRGGMGGVVVARRFSDGAAVAIKHMLPQYNAKPRNVARFHHEMRATSRLESEHVIRVLDWGEVKDEKAGVCAPYMVMELLEGEDFREVLADGPMPVRDAVRHVLAVCEVLAEAHALGIIHRDLKPGNLFLARREGGGSVLKVLDFGIAKFRSRSLVGDEEHVTGEGEMIGSLRYAAPEQLIDAGSVDARSDIFSLGVVLYELVSGGRPFQSVNVIDYVQEVLAGHAISIRARRPEVPSTFEAVVMRCLESRREDRFASAADLARALEPFLGDGDAASAPSRQLLLRTLPLGEPGLRVARAAEPTESVVVPVAEPPAPAPPPEPPSRSRVFRMFAALGLA